MTDFLDQISDEEFELDETDKQRVDDILNESDEEDNPQIGADPLGKSSLRSFRHAYIPDNSEIKSLREIDSFLREERSPSVTTSSAQPQISDPLDLIHRKEIEEAKKTDKSGVKKLEITRRFKDKQLPVISIEEIKPISLRIASAGIGLPSCLSISNNFIVIGTSQGFITVYSHEGHELKRMKVGKATNFGSVTSIDISFDETWAVSGYEQGQVAIWDMTTGNNVRATNSIFSVPILSARFWKVQRQFVVCSDLKGNVALIECVKSFLSTTLTTEMIFRGEAGIVTDIQPLFPDPNRPHASDSHRVIAFGTLNQVLLCTLEPVSTNLLTDEKPTGVNTGVSPCITWFRGMDPNIAIGWGVKIKIFCIKYAVADGVQPIGVIDIDSEIRSLHWLAEDTLLMLDYLREVKIISARLAIEQNFSVGVLETSKINTEIAFQSIIKAEAGRNRSTLHNSVRAFNRSIYILGNTTFHRGKLLNWQECLDHMMRNGDWLQALCHGIDFYLGEGKKLHGVPQNKDVLRNTLELVVKDYVRATNIPWEHKIPVTIEYCIGIGAFDLLFNEMFDFFVDAGTDNKNQQIFMDNLEPFILQDQIKVIPTYILGKMVAYYLNIKRPDIIERMILHLDPNCIDPRFIEAPCREYNLLTAYIFINTNTQHPNFVNPLKSIFRVLRKQEKRDTKQFFTYKLLWYLRLTFEGKTFPNGVIPESSLREAVPKIIDWLLKKNHLSVLIDQDSITTLKVLRSAFEPGVPCNALSKASPSHSEILAKLETICHQNSPAFPHLAYFIARVSSFSSELISKEMCMATAKFLMKSRVETRPSIALNAQTIEAYISLSMFKDFADEDSQIEYDSERKGRFILSMLEKRKDLTSEDVNELFYIAVTSPYTEVLVFLQEIQEKYTDCIKAFLASDNVKIKIKIFDWVGRIFSKLRFSELENIKAIVMNSLNVLVEIDSDRTAKLVKDWFENEHAQIIRKLNSAPQLQLKYLRELVKDSHDKETLNEDLLLLYVELLCKLEPHKVMDFLVSRDDYSLDDCLKLCRQYEVINATAYLYERIGCTRDALKLYLDLLRKKVNALEDTLASRREITQQKIDEISADTTHAVNLCVRNANRLDEAETEDHWFLILDEVLLEYQKFKPYFLSTPILENSIYNSVKDILDSMMDHVDFNSIITHITKNFGFIPFKHFKDSFVSVLSRVSYQENILSKAINLLNYDTICMTQELLHVSCKGASSQDFKCSKCKGVAVTDEMLKSNDEKLLLFTCGHAYHSSCLKEKACETCKKQEAKKGTFLLATRGRKV